VADRLLCIERGDVDVHDSYQIRGIFVKFAEHLADPRPDAC
jgi:hypothetical protein